MSIFTLPAAPAVGTYSDLRLDDRHILRLDTMSDLFEDGTELEVQCSLVLCFPNATDFRSAQYLISGLGGTAADACLAMFADEEIDGLRIPAEVAAALDELAHQAVRIVCNRLSGGTMDEATFADPRLLDTQSGPVERKGLDTTSQCSEPVYRAGATPWTPRPCRARPEYDNPRSKEFVRR